MPAHETATPTSAPLATISRYVLAFLPFSVFVAQAQGGGSGTVLFDDTALFDILCGAQSALTGPIGVAIGIIVLAVGGLMIAFGGKRAVGFVIWGIVGVGLALAAPSLIIALFPGAASGCPS